MLSRENLAQVFGEENIVTLDFDDAMDLGLSELDVLLLSHVGLPRDVGAVFTTELDGPPGIFSVQALDMPDGGANAAIFLGAPGGNRNLRYFLDVKNDLVVLGSLDDTNPTAEVVNSSLSHFVDFVHRIGAFYFAEDMGSETETLSANELAEQLKTRDPYAFRHSNTWWAMAVSAIVQQARGEA